MNKLNYLKKGFFLRMIFIFCAAYCAYAIDRDLNDGDIKTSTLTITKSKNEINYFLLLGNNGIILGVCLFFAFMPYRLSNDKKNQ
jgi:hypothetical protein